MVKFSISSRLIEDLQQVPALKTVDKAADLLLKLSLKPSEDFVFGVYAVRFSMPIIYRVRHVIRIPFLVGL